MNAAPMMPPCKFVRSKSFSTRFKATAHPPRSMKMMQNTEVKIASFTKAREHVHMIAALRETRWRALVGESVVDGPEPELELGSRGPP